MFLGWLVLGEPLTPLAIGAMVVILSGVALVQSSGWKKAPAATPSEPVREAA
jgi:drug/metabolite transporter (DMT)-like permease